MNPEDIEFNGTNRMLSPEEMSARMSAGLPNKLPFDILDVNIERLLRYLDGHKACKQKTNKELAILLLENVWAYIPVSNPVSWILDEVIGRLAPELENENETQTPNQS